MKVDKKGQGATEYLLMLAAVLVIVAIAVYYVTSTGGYPAIGAVAGDNGSHIIIDVTTGSIPAGEWQYSIENTTPSDSWTDGTVELKPPYVVLGGPYPTGTTWYVSLRHKSTGHIYFADQAVTI
ncbi:MAG: class III signal peptide-containing protein [Candidatus Hadarchaeales archaeon]